MAQPAASDDDFFNSLGAKTPNVTPSAPPANDDAFWSGIGANANTDATSQKSPAPPPLGPVGTAAGMVGSIGHGLSVGLDNPLDAAIQWLLPNSAFAKARAQDMLLQQQYETEHPLASGTGQAVGAIPSFMAADAALNRVIPGMIGQGGNVLDKAANLAGQSVRSGIIGGAQGAGLAEGQGGAPPDLQDRELGAGTGAAVGAVVPGVFAAAGSVLKGIVAPIMARFGSGADSQAVAKVAEAAVRDGMTPADVQARLQQLGPDATLADVGGRNMTQLAAGVANKPGPAAQQAQQVLEGRVAQAPQVVNDAITAATGSTGDYHAALAKLGAQRTAEAGPLYDKAFSEPLTPEQTAAATAAQRFAQGPVGDKALQNGMRVVQTEKMTANQPFNPADYGVKVGPDGRFQIDPNAPPSLRLLDAVKGGYDDVVESYRDPTSGKLNLDRQGYAANQARAALVGELRGVSDTYGKALDAWAGPSQAMDAMSMGRRALSNDPEVTADAIGRMSDSQKDFFKVGVARALKDKVDATQEGADVTRRIFGNTLIRNKIAAAFGDPAAFDQFQTTMDQQAQFAKTRNAVLSGSRTAPLLGAMGDVNFDPLTPAALLAHGNFPGAALHIAGQGYNALAGAPGAGPRTAAVGRALFTPSPSDELLAALAKQQESRANLLSLRNVPRALSVTGATQYLNRRDGQ